jgi:hypothetical protein
MESWVRRTSSHEHGAQPKAATAPSSCQFGPLSPAPDVFRIDHNLWVTHRPFHAKRQDDTTVGIPQERSPYAAFTRPLAREHEITIICDGLIEPQIALGQDVDIVSRPPEMIAKDLALADVEGRLDGVEGVVLHTDMCGHAPQRAQRGVSLEPVSAPA